MKDLNHCKDMYEPILGDNTKPKGISFVVWEKMHRKTIGYIRSWIN